MFLYNHPQRKNLRQDLRNAHVPAEVVLWAYLKQRKFMGLKFRRQYGVGPFVVDFYCPEKRIAIELDGDSHFVEGAQAYDQRRTMYITKRNIHLIRFTNQEIRYALDLVLERLATICSTTPSWPAPRSPS
jgi:very-short-patch-repair endonuclease